MALSRRSSRTGRSRFTLLLLVLTSVTVLTLDFRGSGFVEDLRGIASTIFSPLGDGAASVTEPFTDAWNGAFGYSELEDENDRLREQIAEMEGDAAEAADILREGRELEELEGISRYTDIPSVAARVVGGSLTNFEHAIQLDRGSDDGIGEGMPVVTGAGLVGRVVAVTGGRSTVQLLTDPGFDIGVRLATTGEIAIGHGTGDREPFMIDAGIPVSIIEEVEEGEAVATSGLDRSVFPPGIPIGTVSSVDRASDQLSLVLEVEPLADIDNATFVEVLLWEAPE
jgi:rod shape-determining protein MreC